jgi:hypothetical protein
MKTCKKKPIEIKLHYRPEADAADRLKQALSLVLDKEALIKELKK